MLGGGGEGLGTAPIALLAQEVLSSRHYLNLDISWRRRRVISLINELHCIFQAQRLSLARRPQGHSGSRPLDVAGIIPVHGAGTILRARRIRVFPHYCSDGRSDVLRDLADVWAILPDRPLSRARLAILPDAIPALALPLIRAIHRIVHIGAAALVPLRIGLPFAHSSQRRCDSLARRGGVAFLRRG